MILPRPRLKRVPWSPYPVGQLLLRKNRLQHFDPSSQGTAVSALYASPLTRAQFVGVYPNVDMLPGDVVNATQPYPEEAE